MRKAFRYLVCVVLLTYAGEGLLAQNQPSEKASAATKRVLDVRKFGAVGDSIRVNTKAIQKAIDECFRLGGGTVLISGGVYSSGALFLKSNVHLHVAKDTKLRAVAGIENYPILKNTRIAGIEMDWPSAFINAVDAANISLGGKGTIDGSGYYWWENYWSRRDTLSQTVPGDLIDWYVPRPRLVLFDKVTNSRISGLKLMNSGFWTVHICYSKSVVLEGLDIFNPINEEGKRAASTDGIDIDSSRDILVSNCTISVDDDCIAVKSGRGSDGLRVNIPTENVVIENCLFKAGHGGVSMGTETAGGVRNVLVRNCKADGNSAAIKFKPRPGRAGVVEDITHDGWEIKNGGTAIDYAFRKVDGDDYIDEWQKIVVPFARATPRYRNITIRNVKATGMKKGISFLGWPLAHAENVLLDNVAIHAQDAGQFQYVDNLILKNVQVTAPGKALQFTEVTNFVR